MPELPEVELVTRSLDEAVRGRQIANAVLIRGRLAPHTDPASFAKHLKNGVINRVHRRGKHILIELSSNRTLITHLRLSGRFLLLTPDDINPKFTYAVFEFDDDQRLVFEDQRHFGLMKIADTHELFETDELRKLAPEPFSAEFSDGYFYGTLRGSKRNVKELLLDQSKVCGLGNIYASEALFLSGINPKSAANRNSAKRAALLRLRILDVLNEAIRFAEMIPRDPVRIGEGVYGNGSVTSWRVYDRENEPCPNCSRPIARIRQGGRSTYYCRRCQR